MTPATRLVVLLAAVTAALLVAPAARAAGPLPPGRDVSLPPEEVRDTLFAYLVGILRAGDEAEADQAYLREILSEFRRSICLPFNTPGFRLTTPSPFPHRTGKRR